MHYVSIGKYKIKIEQMTQIDIKVFAIRSHCELMDSML